MWKWNVNNARTLTGASVRALDRQALKLWGEVAQKLYANDAE